MEGEDVTDRDSWLLKDTDQILGSDWWSVRACVPEGDVTRVAKRVASQKHRLYSTRSTLPNKPLGI